MKIVLLILFLGWIVFMTLAQSAKVFNKYNLYDRPHDTFKMGFSSRIIKRKISEQSGNIEIVKELKKSLRYNTYSKICLLLFVLAFVITMITQQYASLS
ncbi:MAG: hypothetical protein GQ574_09525 [Crocinitomix sp.]|nr:hypothetical protein [Crocinitomix sp.]